MYFAKSFTNIRGLNNQNRNYSVIKHRLVNDNSYCHIYSIFNIRGLNNQNRNYSVIKHRLVNDNSYYHIYSIFFIYRIMGIIFYNGVNLV